MAIVFFDIDRRKAKHPKAYDTNTLRGRTLQLRDDMLAFLREAPSSEGLEAATTQDGVERVAGSLLRVYKLHHGYDLRFADRAMRIFNEYGERGVRDCGLINAIDQERRTTNTEKLYSIVIERLTELAERPEAVD